MKIAYNKKQMNVNLIIGLLWLVWFFVRVFEDDNPNWKDYGWIVLPSLYLGQYFYQKKYKYLTIENSIINVNGPLGKKLNLNEIKRIKHFAGDYVLKTEHKKLTINSQIMDPISLSELNAELKRLNAEWN